MKKNKTSYVLLLLLVLVVGGIIPSKGYAREVQNVETEGSIGFTGVYNPIGTPEPNPPDTIARPPSNRPNDRLPQTNDQSQYWLTLLGIGLLVLMILIIFCRKRQEEQNNQ